MMQHRRAVATAIAAVRNFCTAGETTSKYRPRIEPPSPSSAGGGPALGKRLLGLVHPKRSAVVTIRKYKEEGHMVRKYELNRIVRELRRLKRYKHSLEICEWMTTQEDIKLLSGDYAVHLDLIAKLRGLSSAEKFFEDMPEKMRGQPTLSSLLHTYVQHRAYEKAEALMEKMVECGYVNCPLPFNHMMTMYLENGQLEKIPLLIRELKKNSEPDIVSYNLWLTMCQSQNDVKEAEKVLLEMKRGKMVPDWMTYSIFISLYLKNDLNDRARVLLKEMEKKVSRKHRSGYSSLISLHSNLGNIEEIDRIWKQLKSLFPKLNDAEYICMIASLIKLGDLETAAKLYDEWESISPSGDTRVPNLLLGAYINGNQIERARIFFCRIVQKGIKPSYTTWEILSRGYLRLKQTENVLVYFEKAVRSVKKWDPNVKLIREVYKLIEEQENFVGAEKLLSILRNAGYVTTEIYNMLLRTYARAEKMPPIIEERMTKDKVSPDDETKELIRITSRMCVSDVSSYL